MALASVLRSHSGGLRRWLRFFQASCSGHWLRPEPRPAEDLAPCGILSALERVGGVASVLYFLTLPALGQLASLRLTRTHTACRRFPSHSHSPLRISHHVGSSVCCDVSCSYFLTIPRSTRTHAAHRLPSCSHSLLRISHHVGSSACCDVSHSYF